MQVQLQNVVVEIAGQPILAGLDFATRPDEYVVILGPSGCGKTTTLRVIAGLQRPDRGEVFFDGCPVASSPPRKRGVAMVFQHDALYPHLTVAKSICLGADRRRNDSELRTRLQLAARMTRIEGLLDRYPDQLSGGELRRAAIAKAIVRQSPVRLLDEPLSALDAVSRQLLQDDLLEWHREVPGTTIHVTHDGDEAMRMADRIAILDQGRIAQFDSPAKIYHEPENLAAARAIGVPSINLIPARLAGGTLVSTRSDIQFHVEPDNSAEDRDICIAVRPEALRVHSEREPSQTSAWRGMELTATLLDVRQSVHQPTVRAQFGDRSIHGVLGGRANESSQAIHAEIRMRADASQLLIFDANTEQRVHLSLR